MTFLKKLLSSPTHIFVAGIVAGSVGRYIWRNYFISLSPPTVKHAIIAASSTFAVTLAQAPFLFRSWYVDGSLRFPCPISFTGNYIAQFWVPYGRNLGVCLILYTLSNRLFSNSSSSSNNNNNHNSNNHNNNSNNNSNNSSSLTFGLLGSIIFLLAGTHQVSLNPEYHIQGSSWQSLYIAETELFQHAVCGVLGEVRDVWTVADYIFKVNLFNFHGPVNIFLWLSLLCLQWDSRFSKVLFMQVKEEMKNIQVHFSLQPYFSLRHYFYTLNPFSLSLIDNPGEQNWRVWGGSTQLIILTISTFFANSAGKRFPPLSELYSISFPSQTHTTCSD